ncbi:MAG: adenosylmethionine--8-amino-7-oxononanoate transaminase [Pyrinomonadaceae bacterium]
MTQLKDNQSLKEMMDLAGRDRAHLWHPYTQEKTAPVPIPVVRGKGVWLELVDGRKILDGISSWWVNIHGHSHDYLNEALAKQARELEHVIFAGFTHRPAIELAEKLVEILPIGLTRVFYSDNGSTAVEVALKMAYQFWLNCGQERTTFIALKGAYHGDTFGAMAASDDSSFTAPFKNLLFKVLRAASPNTKNFIESLEKILAENSQDIAAVIIEPMLQGAGGMIVWQAEDLRRVRELCDEHNVLLIADEVLTGFGRTGKMFACEYAQITPDIICLSKALTAGYLPLGATVAKEKIYQAFLSDDRQKTFFHGHSFTANPLACAVARASLELFERENSLEKVRVINRKFHERLPRLLNLEIVSDVRIIGAVGIIELNESGGYLANIGQRLFQEFLARNILLRPLGNVLYFMPPYVISENEIDWVLDEIEKVLQQL